ncbi:MAG TPA: lycopene cyclase family protein [Kineosporiaceae bacterium]|nr:lycopene cyclase family protein [Kineosporiaceae bacterium]
MDLECDILVLGAGAAGLALTARLTGSTRPQRRVVLADAQPDPLAGRAWAYWSARRTALDAAVSARWSRLVVVAGGRRLELDPGPYDYRLVRGEDLAALVEPAARRSGVVRLTGAVHALEDGPDVVRLAVGDVAVRARWVLDSRPPPPPRPDEVRLRFLGRQVRTGRPVFDPACATLMDFSVRAPGEVRFCYLLPTAPDTALVEVAALAAGSATREDLSTTLDDYLAGVVGAPAVEVLRQEAGDLPLRRPGPRRAGHRVLRVGCAGGMLKPSTGYAFDRIVRDADAVVGSLDRHGHPWALPPRHRRHLWLDQVLLDVVRDDPGAIEPAFARMFARNPAARVLRFLDEDTRLPEELRLIAGLTPGPFLRTVRNRILPGHR